MKISKAKHFWTWFQKNNKTYLELPRGTKEELIYYMRELFAHLISYGKGVGAEIFWGLREEGDTPTVVFTTYGNCRHFRKCETLVAKAPKIPGWNFIALQPPRKVDSFIEEDFGHLNIDPFNLWFEPPGDPGATNRVHLKVYAEMYTEFTEEFEQAVKAVVYNVLGEKVYALEIQSVYLDNLLELSKEERVDLVNLQQLQEYVKLRELSTIVINGRGALEDLKY